MARDATINVSLTPEQLQLVRTRVNSGHYGSASELVRESLRALFGRRKGSASRDLKKQLAKGYQAMAEQDRKIAREWASLPEAWPEK